jgi:hypothetical protein
LDTGTELGPRGTAGADRRAPYRVLLGVGLFVAVLAAIYWATAYEEAGTTLLVLAAALVLWPAAYLWLRARERDREAGDERGPEVDHEVEEYLPHSSPWPFAIGVGAFLALNGVLAGGWFFFPGAVVLLAGIAGFIRQSRLRS